MVSPGPAAPLALDDSLADILAQPLHAVLAVNRPGRSPQLSVVWFDWDGRIVRFSTRRSRAKFRLLSDDPRVTLLVDDPATNRYVCLVGTAEATADDHAGLARRLRGRYLPDAGEPGPAEPDRVVVRVTPSRIFGGS